MSRMIDDWRPPAIEAYNSRPETFDSNQSASHQIRSTKVLSSNINIAHPFVSRVLKWIGYLLCSLVGSVGNENVSSVVVFFSISSYESKQMDTVTWCHFEQFFNCDTNKKKVVDETFLFLKLVYAHTRFRWYSYVINNVKFAVFH